MDPVRIGVIGCGVIGRKHMNAASRLEHIELVAAADLMPEPREKAAAEFDIPDVYESGEALIAEADVEAVVLALPTGVRLAPALKALDRGLHVLLEKPVAMNMAEARQIKAARGDRVVACASSRARFRPHAAVATDFIAEGRLGPLRTLHVRAFTGRGAKPERPGPAWRLRRDLNGGGILVNWGVYDLDYMLGLVGWSITPRTALARCWQAPPRFASHIHPDSDAETHFAALIACDNNVAITIERGEFTATGKEDAWQIIGDDGSLSLQMVGDNPIRVVHYRADEQQGAVPSVIYEGEEGWDVMHTGPIGDFATAVRSGGEPMTSLERAMVVQRITDAIYASAEEGSPVAIAE